MTVHMAMTRTLNQQNAENITSPEMPGQLSAFERS
jgi:hypothetical protein